MRKRKVHLRPNTVVNIGHTKTSCGRVLFSPRGETSGAVSIFGTLSGSGVDIDVTVHGTLVTCAQCLERMKIRRAVAWPVCS